LNVIAEVKRSSPSQGAIAPLYPVAAARQYVDGGAAAISVLTEERHFGGQLAHLEQVAQDRATWHRYVPLLRKDFTVHPLQLHEAREAGGDAVLLIVAVLGTSTARFLRAAHGYGLAALVEVHDDAELDLALESGAEVIGVNNRDLTTLNVDLATAPRLLARARDAGYQGVLVAESGYRTREDLAPVEGLADAVLVGTGLAGSRDPAGPLRRPRGVEACPARPPRSPAVFPDSSPARAPCAARRPIVGCLERGPRPTGKAVPRGYTRRHVDRRHCGGRGVQRPSTSYRSAGQRTDARVRGHAVAALDQRLAGDEDRK